MNQVTKQLMNKHNLLLQAAAAAMLIALSTVYAQADEPARVETFQAEDGQSYFALTARPADKQPDGARDVIVLFDTSASQAGFFRETAMAALQSCIDSLESGDRVRIVAVDLEARAMGDSFAGPGSHETTQALQAIGNEPPLGSTDMELALKTASEMFDTSSHSDKVILYVGDGMSPANLLEADNFAKIVGNLRNKQISVNSFAVGPQQDTALLAALANQTGGNLYIDSKMTWPDKSAGITTARAVTENRRRGAEAGKALGRWVRAGVVWPTATEWPAEVAKAYPAQMPPLRTDRTTVVVGKLSSDKIADFAVRATDPSGKPLAWQAVIAPAANDLSYLPALIDSAKSHDGVALTTLGSKGLAETGRLLLEDVEQLTNAAERAAKLGDREGAGHIVEAVLRRDPGNLRARTVQQFIENETPVTPIGLSNEPLSSEPATARPVTRMAARPVASSGDLSLTRIAQAPAGVTVHGPTSGELLGGLPAADVVMDGSLLTETERQNRVFSEMLEKEVELAISEARDNMRSNPDSAAQNLKLMLENVHRAPQLIAEVRAQLADKLQSVIQETARAASVKADIDREIQELQASARERKLLNNRFMRTKEKEKQLMSRFNALMDERRYVEAHEVADIIAETDPGGTAPVQADFWSHLARSHYMQQTTRRLRHKAAWDTLFQTELSSIPFSDGNPIVYPEAEVWEELTHRREKYKAVDLKSLGGAEERISKALSDPLNSLGLEFDEVPLEEVVAFLRDEYNIEVQLDIPALDDLGIEPDEPITINLRNISLRSALRLMLKQLTLTYVIADEVLLITSEEEALTRLQVKVYPVADLVLPIQSGGGFGGGFGGGGQGGGGFGGGGQGGGGGGFGGGGQGGGGFGGGGGQFSVADNSPSATIVKNIEKIELVAQPVTEVKEAASLSTSSTKANDKTKIIEVDEQVSPELFWEGYFGGEIRDHAQVRRTVTHLMKKGEYAHVITLIQASLRHGQPQPWMYEALSIAMQMDGRDKVEIERAIMSAADFSRSAGELMNIAQYLSRLDLDRRAVQLYQQVVKIDPLRSEAYAFGLRAAQRAEDLDGIQWATVGILQQAWPLDQVTVKETAWRVAKATIADLVKQGKQAEAQTYRDQIADAIQRDCVIRVTWTGDADIDLIVDEPGGTRCSSADPRSAGGGVSLGDVYTGSGGKTEGTFGETYVCPRGFAGDYQATIRSIWGKVAAGKVTVDVYLHHNGKQVKHERQQLALTKEGATLRFTLDEGRRTDPIEGQFLASAIKRQEAVSRAVLAQQLRSLSDPRAIPLRPGDRRARRQRLLAGNGGSVGFQPVIQILPSGAQMTATAVVSADRRYVRITPTPVFSTIGDVTTFTFAGAGAGVDNGDGDGGDDPADPPVPAPVPAPAP